MNRPEYEDKLLNNVIIEIQKCGGQDCLSSIILTGSFGREEPTYTISVDGSLHLESDVEIALVFHDTTQKDMVNQIIQKVSEKFEEDLNIMAINEKRVRKACNFNFSLRVPKYKTIFMYDLFNGSKTIWGYDFLKENNIVITDVDLYEAKRLVANRIGELIYLQNAVAVQKKEYLRKQWKGKLVLSIVSAWLICEREYVSSYHGQYDKAKMLAKKMEKQIGTNFFEEYTKVFQFLRKNGTEYEVDDGMLRSYVKQIDKYFELHKIKRPKVNSISRTAKYCVRYLKTGMKYGIVGFENRILQALITHYYNQDLRLKEDADVWHRVLY